MCIFRWNGGARESRARKINKSRKKGKINNKRIIQRKTLISVFLEVNGRI